MARQTPKRPARASREEAPEPPSGLVLRRSPARLKLEALEKEHERLLRQIEKKKLSCDTTRSVVRDAHVTLDARAEPLRAALGSALREIHQIFSKLLSPRSRLARTERAQLGRFYREALGGLPQPEDFEAPSEEPTADAPDASGPPPPSDGDWAEDSHAADHASAPKPSERNTSLLRALYKRLTVALHPDKARDPSESARLTSVMKEVTRAYAHEDLAKLVELERTWLAQSPAADVEDDFERRAALLLEANRALRRQLRGLAAHLSELEQSLPGVSWPKRKLPPSGAEIAAEILAAIERELQDIERLRDKSRWLLEGRISVWEFLVGPKTAAAPADDPLGDLYEQLLDELLGAGPHRSAAAARRKPRRR